MAEVDPRFDPLFQRGYDPARHRTKVPRVEERREAPPLRGEASRSVETPAEPPNRRSDTLPAERSGSIDGSIDGQTSESADDLELPRRNPYRLILLIASIACIGGAAVLFWRRVEDTPYQSSYGPDVASTFAYQFTDALMVPLLTGGLLGFCLWLVLGAVKRADD